MNDATTVIRFGGKSGASWVAQLLIELYKYAMCGTKRNVIKPGTAHINNKQLYFIMERMGTELKTISDFIAIPYNFPNCY